MTDFQTIVAEINAAGLRVNNLFQIEDGRWQANLYDYNNSKGYAFVVHADPVAALQECFEKVKPDDDSSDLI